jgi:hypothetical protein
MFAQLHGQDFARTHILRLFPNHAQASPKHPSPVALTISNKCRRLKGIEQLYMIEIAWSGAKTKQTPFWCLLRMISSNLVDASWWPQAPSNLQRTSEALGFTWCYTIFRYLSLHPLVPWSGCNWNASIHPRKIGLKFPQDGKKLAGSRKERGAEKVRVCAHYSQTTNSCLTHAWVKIC